MSFKTDLDAYLKARGGITAQVGQRIYPRKAPQSIGTQSRLTYNRVGRANFMSLSGESGLTRERFQFTAWSQSELVTDATVEALRDALDGFRGLIGTTDVQAAFEENAIDLAAEPEPGAGDGAWYTTAVDYMFFHAQVAPTFA